jgi:hypothetical protein
MAETSRVARWRQRLHNEGKVAITLWLTEEDKGRLVALAQQWRTSPSALVAEALAGYQPTCAPTVAPDTDPPQIQVLIREVLREELPGMVRELLADSAMVTDMSTDIVTETRSSERVPDIVTETVAATLARDLPPLVREIVEGLALEALGLPVTDAGSNVTETEPPGEARAASEQGALPKPAPRGEIPPWVSEDLVKIVEARRQYPAISERTFAQFLFDRGIYRHRAKDGREVPIPHTTLRGWLQRAQEAELL